MVLCTTSTSIEKLLSANTRSDGTFSQKTAIQRNSCEAL